MDKIKSPPSYPSPILTCNLQLFQDQANDEWGVTHRDTIAEVDSFNAFWDGMGLFHDVWEHNFEFTNKYFRGKGALNIGGEMAAMGAMWYYLNQLGMFNRLNPQSTYTYAQTTIAGTLDMVTERVKYGYGEYGKTLVCNVPSQEKSEDEGLEDLIQDYFKEVQKCKVEEINSCNQEDKDLEKEIRENFKKSFTLEKIANLHRWGYNRGKFLLPDTRENLTLAVEFKKFWEKFCKERKAEDLKDYFKEIEFKIFKVNGEKRRWEAEFISKYPEVTDIENYKIKSENPHLFYPEECYIFKGEEEKQEDLAA